MKNKAIIISCFVIGAVANTYNSLLMIRSIFDESLLNTVKEYLGYGGFFAIGWTILLFWGMFKPMERRVILLISVIPIVGSIFSNSIIHIQDPFPFWKFLCIVLVPVTISTLFIFTYIFTREKKEPVE